MSTMPAAHAEYLQRVLVEQEELTEKLCSLRVFIAADAFHELEEHHQHLLMAQAAHMADYSNILAQRITLFLADD